jgi:hypothetical protein
MNAVDRKFIADQLKKSKKTHAELKKEFSTETQADRDYTKKLQKDQDASWKKAVEARKKENPAKK